MFAPGSLLFGRGQEVWSGRWEVGERFLTPLVCLHGRACRQTLIVLELKERAANNGLTPSRSGRTRRGADVAAAVAADSDGSAGRRGREENGFPSRSAAAAAATPEP